jgi:hypothetical protein
MYLVVDDGETAAQEQDANNVNCYCSNNNNGMQEREAICSFFFAVVVGKCMA